MVKEDLKNIPDSPGVYFFLGLRNKILYIGKATSLKNRVKSYFTSDIVEKRSVLIAQMVENAKKIEYRETDSVLEALILEASLIKTHRPKYNSIQKDDKSFNYVVFTKEKYPRVLIVREKDLGKYDPKYLFGPFPHGGQLKEALKIIRKIFPFFDTRRSVDLMREEQLRFNQEIGLYPTDLSNYSKTITHLKLFFEGKKKVLLGKLEKEMLANAKKREFEKADVIKKQIFALNHIQDVSLIKEELSTPKEYFRIEAYDVAHMGGKDTVGVMTVVEDGELQKGGYRKFKISVDQNNDIASLKEILDRRLNHDEWMYPKLIVVDGGTAHKRAAETMLREYGFQIPVVAVVKNEKHQPKDILGKKELVRKYDKAILLANNEAHRFAISYHRKIRG